MCHRTHSYADLSTDVGYSNVKTSFGNKVDLLSLGFSGTAAWGESLFIGLTGEYQVLTRMIKTNSNVKFYKNQKQVMVVPTAGFQLEGYTFKFSVSNVGYSVLSQQKGDIVSKGKDAKGISFVLVKKVGEHFALGSSYSTSTFSQVSFENSESSQNSLRDSARLITASIVFAYIF